MGTRDSFPGVKRPEHVADHSPPNSVEVKKNMDVFIHFPIRLHGVVLNWLNRGTILPFINSLYYLLHIKLK
jgi:hypothetical protein